MPLSFFSEKHNTLIYVSARLSLVQVCCWLVSSQDALTIHSITNVLLYAVHRLLDVIPFHCFCFHPIFQDDGLHYLSRHVTVVDKKFFFFDLKVTDEHRSRTMPIVCLCLVFSLIDFYLQNPEKNLCFFLWQSMTRMFAFFLIFHMTPLNQTFYVKCKMLDRIKNTNSTKLIAATVFASV